MVAIRQGAIIFARPSGRYRLVAPSPNVGGYMWSIELPPELGRLESAGGLDVEGGRIGGGSIPYFDIVWADAPRGEVTLTLKRPWETGALDIIRHEVQ